MRIVKQIRWDQSEVIVFKNLKRWLDLWERADLDQDEIKALARLANDPAAPSDRLKESLAAWEKVLNVMRQQKTDAAKLEPNTPESGVGIIAKPRQMMVALQEAADMAISDITKAVSLVKFGIGFLEGEIYPLLEARVEDESGILEFEVCEYE